MSVEPISDDDLDHVDEVTPHDPDEVVPILAHYLNGLIARIRALEADLTRKDAALRHMIAAHTWHERAPTPYVTWEGIQAENASKASALASARAALTPDEARAATAAKDGA